MRLRERGAAKMHEKQRGRRYVSDDAGFSILFFFIPVSRLASRHLSFAFNNTERET